MPSMPQDKDLQEAAYSIGIELEKAQSDHQED